MGFKSSLFILCLFHAALSFSQGRKITPILIGEKVPDFVFQNVWNYKLKKAKLSSFNARLVILDFWNTSCLSCIDAFPKMSSLQKQFGDKIQILLVNSHKTKYETPERIKHVIDHYKVRTGDALDLPIPIYDTILNSYFPHYGVPHEVWIDNMTGIVIGITRAREVTEQNIKSILDGNKINMPVKNDFYDFDSRVPLLVNNNGGPDDEFVFRSLFTKYNSRVRTMIGSRLDKHNEVNGYFVFNYPLRGLISMAYPEQFRNICSENRIVYNVKNISQYIDDGDTLNKYCYDISMTATKGKAFDSKVYLQKDLAAVFNIKVNIEKRKVNSYIIISTDKSVQAYTKFANIKHEIELQESSIKKFLHNYSLDEAIKILEGYVDKPLINESNVSQNIDIDFPDHFDLSDKKGIIEVLKKTGFVIKEEERELEVVVITDKEILN